MASTVRGQVNKEILAGIRDRMTPEERRELLGLPDVVGLDRKTLLRRQNGRPSISGHEPAVGTIHLVPVAQAWVNGRAIKRI
jgi:hypothetical protein